MKKKRWLTALLAGCSLCASHAQTVLRTDTNDLREIRLDEVVVTGTGTEHYLKDAPVQTEVITGKALEQYNGRSLDEILSALSPSITFSPGDMGSNIQLNGLKNDYILIMVNGKRMNGDIGGQNDLSIINPATIERIEIVKGASSSLYGSDAIAGVINIITKKNRDKVSVSNTTRVGNYDDLLQSEIIGFSNGKLNSTTSASMKHTGGWQNTTQEWYHHDLQEGSVSKTVSRSTNFTLSQNFTYKASDRLSLSADASYYQKWIFRPVGPWKYYLYDYFYRNQDYALGLKYRLNDKRSYLTADASFGQYNYYFDYTGQEVTNFFHPDGTRVVNYPGDRVLQTMQRRWLNHVKGVFYLGDNHILSAGIEHQHDYLKSPYRLEQGKASVYTLASYAQDEWSITNRLNLTLGYRFVHHKEFGQKFTPKISAKYSLGDFNLRATYSYGFKAPTLKELYQNYITVIMGPLKAYYGNENLKPQSSNYGSASVEYSNGKFQATVTGYYNRIHNMIALTVVPTSSEDKFLEVEETMKYNNLAKARSFGADFTFNYQVLPSLAIGGGYSYTDAKAQYTEDQNDPNYMKYLPINATSYHNANWKIAWTHKDVGVSLFGRYQSTRYYITDGNGKAYQLWRLNVRSSLLKTKKWNLGMNAGIDNIFNYIDRTPFGKNRGTTSPGRTLYLSLNVKFQNKQK